MLKIDKRTLARLEEAYPGIGETIRHYEEATLPACSRCASENTAKVICGVVGRSINLAGATTKVKLVPNDPPGGYFCNTCGKFFSRIHAGDRGKPSEPRDQPDQAEGRRATGAACSTAIAQEGDTVVETGRLQEDVRACREALKLCSREAARLEWASAQNDLGRALLEIGERESNPGLLEEAVAANREALKVYSRKATPLQWAITQDDLGAALLTLGDLGGGTAHLEEAVTAFREALKEYSGKHVPSNWKAVRDLTERSLGEALTKLKLRKALDREHLVQTFSPEGATARMPRTAKYLGEVEWASSPAHSRADSLFISSEKSRSRWILWVVWPNPWEGPRFLEMPLAICPKKGIPIEEAATALVTAFYRSEARTGLDRFLILRGGELLKEEDLEAIADVVWGR